MNYTKNYKLRMPEGHEYYDVEDFNSNAEIVDQVVAKLNTELNKIAATVGSPSTEYTVILPTNGWEDNVITVSIPNVNSESIVIMGIAMNVTDEEFEAILAAKINAIALGSESVTLKAYGDVPEIDITLSFVVAR